jgi:hypothetical protein
MRIKQVSVFVENEPGHLEAILEALEQVNISIRALSVSDTAEFGIVRMILDKPEDGQNTLHQAGFTTRIDWILAAEIPDVPGGLLNSVAKPMADAGVNIKYFYAYIGMAGKNKATVVFKPDDIDKAEGILASQ